MNKFSRLTIYAQNMLNSIKQHTQYKWQANLPATCSRSSSPEIFDMLLQDLSAQTQSLWSVDTVMLRLSGESWHSPFVMQSSNNIQVW